MPEKLTIDAGFVNGYKKGAQSMATEAERKLAEDPTSAFWTFRLGMNRGQIAAIESVLAYAVPTGDADA